MSLYRKFILLIALSALVAVLILILSLGYFRDQAQQQFINSLEASASATSSAFINDQFDRLEITYEAHAVWTELQKAIQVHDIQWIDENAGAYMVNTSLGNIDYVYMYSPDHNFERLSPADFPISLMRFNSSWESLHNHTIHRDIIWNDNRPYLMVSGPITDNDKKNPSGLFIIGMEFDDLVVQELSEYLNAFELSELELHRPDSIAFGSTLNASAFRLSIPWPNAQEPDLIIRLTYRIEILELLFSRTTRHLIYVTFSVFLLFAIFWYINIRKNTRKIEETVQAIESIAAGDYHIELPPQGAKEIQQLTHSVNLLASDLKSHIDQLEMNYLGAIQLLVTTMEVTDAYTKGHSERVAYYAYELGQRLDYPHLDMLHTAALVHDIGKISISSQLLNKPGKLTDEEFAAIKRHPQHGFRILDASYQFDEVKHIVVSHHEKFDGSGYPDGLKGEKIPLGARILAVADVFDALTSDRSYRAAMDFDKAMMIIRNDKGSAFDPQVVDCFEQCALDLYHHTYNVHDTNNPLDPR